MDRKNFTKTDLTEILENIVDKTLGQIDVNNVFERTLIHPKITGIAGDVIEQSVLGMLPDSYQMADIFVDGIETEVKSTGIRKPKKASDFEYEAKEPMSITAVSPENIVNESFLESHFWNKLDDMLIVYYEYASDTTVKAAEYADFPVRGYDFHKFSQRDKNVLMNDWSIVRNFIEEIQLNYDEPELEYPRLSSELRDKLMYIDTAPKWPNRPRFRLKRATVSAMMQGYFGKRQEVLNVEINTVASFDTYLGELTRVHRGKPVSQLLLDLRIPFTLNAQNEVSKSVTEKIAIGMFGGEASKISDIDLFNKMGLISKTVTQTKAGKRTEDIKLFKIDFEEWMDPETQFEDSFIYNYFMEQQFLCVIFEEQHLGDSLLNKKFVGFKRIILPSEIIETEVRAIWEQIRFLVNSKTLAETIVKNKDGQPRFTPKTGQIITSLNFPKSSKYSVFVRGSSTDANYKPLMINGIAMYAQYIWIKGIVFLDLLEGCDFLGV